MFQSATTIGHNVSGSGILKIRSLKIFFSDSNSFISFVSYMHGRFFCMEHNVVRYVNLPIAGDFLSSYTKVVAGYNP